MKYKIPNSFYIACISITIVLIYAMRSVLNSPNINLITSVDGMGYSTIIIDAANDIRNLNFVSWFPYWLNSTTLYQYCPPLSYLVAAIIQTFTNNITLTLKIFMFTSMFIGSIGVWYFCYRYVDKKYSFIGGMLYAVHPFLLSTLLKSGIYAQGFIFAVTPWFVLFSLLYFEKKDRKLWAVNIIFTALLFMSNISFSIMVCFCMTLCFLMLFFIKRINLSELILWLAAVCLGVFLVSFWLLPGATSLENPMIKYFLQNDVMSWTANWSWFTWDARKFTPKFFPLSYLIITVILGIYMLIEFIKKKSNKISTIMIFMFMLTVATIICSLGSEFIPFHKDLIAGRILALTAMSGTVLCVLLIRIVFSLRISIIRFSCIVLLSVLLVSEVLPFEIYHSDPMTEMKNLMEAIPDKSHGFDKGRFSWIANVNSEVSYLSYIYGFNSSDGWNIEGNKRNRFVSNFNIALSSNCEQYIMKHLQNSNVRTVFISSDYPRLVESLTDTGFENIAQIKDNLLLYNKEKSSYFIKNRRNAILIGKALGINLNFPWLVEGKSPNLTDYTVEELNDYNIIYLCEPEINNIYHLKSIEAMINTLAAHGKTVIIEPGKAQLWQIMGVSPFRFSLKPDSVLKTEPDYISDRYCNEMTIEQGESTALIGLDNIYYKLYMPNSRIDLPIIGSKYVEGGEVYFIGMSLSQMLYSSIIDSMGQQSEDIRNELLKRDKSIESILLSIIDKGSPYKSIKSETFDMESNSWNNKGGEFKYNSENDEDVIVSVSYSPQWEIDVDGMNIPIKQFENLMLISLPSGQHTVTLRFTMTLIGKLSLALSIFSFTVLIFLLFMYDKIKKTVDKSADNFIEYITN